MSEFQEYDLNGTPLGPMGQSGIRDGAIAFSDPKYAAEYFRKELQKQKDARGEFGPRTSVLGNAVGRAMEGWGASPETIKTWIGEKNYTAPPPVNKTLEENVNKIDYQHPAGQWGRNGDQVMAHLMPGETIVPPVISPELRSRLYQEMEAAGVPIDQYVVGAGMSINPVTGMPEFGFKKAFKKIRKAVSKVVSKVTDIPIIGDFVLPAIGATVLPGVGLGISSTLGGAIGSAANTAVKGGSWGQILGSGLGSYLGGSLASGAGQFGPSGTVGASLNSIGLGEVAGILPASLAGANTSVLTGSLLGSALGNAAGGMIDPPKMDWGTDATNYSSLAYQTPTANTTGVAIPSASGAGTTNSEAAANDNTAALRGAGITVGSPSNVNYLTNVIDRDTGRPRTINTSFSSNFDTSRRGGWGVSFA